VLEEVLEGLFHIAKADGAVTSDELDFMESVSRLFAISPLTYRRILSEQLGPQPGDPYLVLGVKPDAPDDEVKAAWKRLMRQHHPDLSAPMGAAATGDAEARSSAVNQAYDRIMRERHELLASDAV